MERMIRQIVEKEFGEPILSISEIVGKGVVNKVSHVVLRSGEYILRMKQGEEALAIYTKEKWCMEQMPSIGVPSPRPFALGMHNDYAYAFQEYIPGLHGRDVPAEEGRIWRTLGEYAKKVNSIPAPQLRRDLTALDDKLFGSHFFLERQIFSESTLNGIKSRLDQVQSWDISLQLCHANLHPSNVVIHPSGTIYLIDWGTASGSRAPHEELADLYSWNSGKENIRIFLEGYGISARELGGMMHDIQTLVLSRMMSVLHFKLMNSPDWRSGEFTSSVVDHVRAIKDFDAPVLFPKQTS